MVNFNFFITKLGILVDLIVLFIIITIIRVKVRGFFWAARDGSELSLRDFFRRWGRGIEGITPLQQDRTQLLGTWIVVSGMIGGLGINLLIRLENVWWWLSIILLGSLIVTSVSMIGIYQRYKIHKKVEQTMKELEENNGQE